MTDHFKPVHPAPPPTRPVAGFAFILVVFILLVIIGAVIVAW
ncbi:hypothetical protein J2S74_000080 [Evansella vedderi]|uniref:Uncharacterized protein n=1 Tax=Evansella vedderi TaxID=38282 RepID=A0ABT9ZN99_9BACI|nr:sporulation protein YjcZ [Evansella vedderi]MDQ0252708.1 hypothetical protein [Evansella vedderi]